MSLLGMVRVAVRTLFVWGWKRTWKVVLIPALTGLPGVTVRLKSAAAGPLMATRGEPVNWSDPLPRLAMVKVRVKAWPITILPKLVWSVRLGVVSPSAIA